MVKRWGANAHGGDNEELLGRGGQGQLGASASACVVAAASPCQSINGPALLDAATRMRVGKLSDQMPAHVCKVQAPLEKKVATRRAVRPLQASTPQPTNQQTNLLMAACRPAHSTSQGLVVSSLTPVAVRGTCRGRANGGGRQAQQAAKRLDR